MIIVVLPSILVSSYVVNKGQTNGFLLASRSQLISLALVLLVSSSNRKGKDSPHHSCESLLQFLDHVLAFFISLYYCIALAFQI